MTISPPATCGLFDSVLRCLCGRTTSREGVCVFPALSKRDHLKVWRISGIAILYLLAGCGTVTVREGVFVPEKTVAPGPLQPGTPKLAILNRLGPPTLVLPERLGEIWVYGRTVVEQELFTKGRTVRPQSEGLFLVFDQGGKLVESFTGRGEIAEPRAIVTEINQGVMTKQDLLRRLGPPARIATIQGKDIYQWVPAARTSTKGKTTSYFGIGGSTVRITLIIETPIVVFLDDHGNVERGVIPTISQQGLR